MINCVSITEVEAKDKDTGRRGEPPRKERGETLSRKSSDPLRGNPGRGQTTEIVGLADDDDGNLFL